jgi:hypothetical protein
MARMVGMRVSENRVYQASVAGIAPRGIGHFTYRISTALRMTDVATDVILVIVG